MEDSPLLIRVSTAVAYAVCSVLVVFINKVLLTNFRFPSFLIVGLGQMTATVIVLWFAALCNFVSVPAFDSSVPLNVFPLPIFYVLNLISGLGGTQRINLPMFTVLRRFSILMTMVLEYVVLGVKASYAVKISVALMILGSVIAAVFDLTFDIWGYSMILTNDICTAANSVYIKQKLNAKKFGKYGILYYNALFMIFPVIVLAWINQEFEKVHQYIIAGNMTIWVAVCLSFSFLCGFLLNYSIILCTQHNSALTTSCIGPIKNLLVTYVGMFSSGDYLFGWNNFIGINISIMGSLLYTYVTFKTETKGTEQNAGILPKVDDKQPLL
ncbi:UDP-sugar transporter-like protein [Brugia malayi]|uniref:UDP-sugar transporter-like protein n=1 Tax=Brugia malayi TaxID=6279 RepID=A0A4E9FBC5_BRUMA|nr:UDP-sugar transporter-like protein [Brugia malayi]VIO93519.1 UDP-sugar transporter-like protein [Brugia malayi]